MSSTTNASGFTTNPATGITTSGFASNSTSVTLQTPTADTQITSSKTASDLPEDRSRVQLVTPQSVIENANGSVDVLKSQGIFVSGTLEQTLQSYAGRIPQAQFDQFYQNIAAVSSLYGAMKTAMIQGDKGQFDGLVVNAAEILSNLVIRDVGGDYGFKMGEEDDASVPFQLLQAYTAQQNTQSKKSLTHEEIKKNIQQASPLHSEIEWLKKEFSNPTHLTELPSNVVELYGGKALIEKGFASLAEGGLPEVGSAFLESAPVSGAIARGIGGVLGEEAGLAVASGIGAESILAAGAAAVGVDAALVAGGVVAGGAVLAGLLAVGVAGYGIYKALGGTRTLDLPEFSQATEWIGSFFSP